MDRAQQWREAARTTALIDAVELELPSGAKVMARRPGPAFFAEHGRLPLSLAAKAAGEDVGGGAALETATDGAVADFMTFLREVLLFCVLDPRISVSPGPGEISPREIPDTDVRYIVEWAIRGPEAVRLESFRRRPADGSDRGDGKDVRVPSKRIIGDRGSGTRVKRGPGRVGSVPAPQA